MCCATVDLEVEVNDPAPADDQRLALVVATRPGLEHPERTSGPAEARQCPSRHGSADLFVRRRDEAPVGWPGTGHRSLGPQQGERAPERREAALHVDRAGADEPIRFTPRSDGRQDGGEQQRQRVGSGELDPRWQSDLVEGPGEPLGHLGEPSAVATRRGDGAELLEKGERLRADPLPG
jgi:hypothetical protein